MNDVAQELELPKADAIVQRYLELRDYIKQENDAHAARMAPYREAMTALSAAASMLMEQTGQKALKTEFGTCFPSTTLSVTCSDVQAFHAWVLQYKAMQFLTAHVAKDAVEQYMTGAGEGHPPPGVKVEKVISINFRKA